MENAIEGTYAVLESRISHLIKLYAKDTKNTRKVLRTFYKMAVFEEKFDNALIEFLKQAITNFIRTYYNDKINILELDKTLEQRIIEYEHVSLDDFINRRVLANEADPTKMIFILAPLAMGVELHLLEYPKLSEDNIGFYASEPKNLALNFLNPLNSKKEKIYLLRTSMILYDILYAAEEIMITPSFLTYDKEIDVIPVTDPNLIIAAVCCSKGYYLPGYYRTMLKRGKLSQTCLVCGKKLDDESYKKLKNYKWKFMPYKEIIAGGLTLIAFGVSMLFVVSHGLSY